MSSTEQLKAPWESWSPGTKVVVTGGILKSLTGEITSYDPNTHQFLVTLDDGRQVPLPANVMAERTEDAEGGDSPEPSETPEPEVKSKEQKKINLEQK